MAASVRQSALRQPHHADQGRERRAVCQPGWLTGIQQYVNQVGSQVFNTHKSDISAKDHSAIIESPEPPELPEPLATPEAMVLWQKAQQAGYVNEHFQPLLSRTLSAILAFEMAKRLVIKDKWKTFETLWDRRNMYRDYYTSLNQNQSLEFREKLKAVFA